MSFPTEWDDTGSTTKRPVIDFIDWKWEGAAYGYDDASALFDFRVYPFIDEGQTADVDEDNAWGTSFKYKVVDISGEGRGFNVDTDEIEMPTQQRLIREILMLSYATYPVESGHLPRRNEPLFPAEGANEYAITQLSSPIVDSINISQDIRGGKVWIVSYKAKKIKYGDLLIKPEPTEVPTSQLQIPPWEIEETVRISCSTEDYVMGGGYPIAEPKTPGDVKSYIDGGTAGADFVSAASGTYEVVKNTAGDPFKSPPPMKVGVTTYTIEKSFQNDVVLTGLVSGAKSAMTEVNNSEITFSSLSTSYSIPSGNAMLTGFSVNPATFVEKADWLPKQKHPFGKTYEDLGWTPNENSDKTKIAVNYFNKTLEVNRAVVYKVVSATIVERVLGWGVFIPNKGYRQLLAGVKDAIREKDRTKTDESFLDANGTALADDATTGHLLLGWTPYSAGGNLKTLMSDLFAASQTNP